MELHNLDVLWHLKPKNAVYGQELKRALAARPRRRPWLGWVVVILFTAFVLIARTV